MATEPKSKRWTAQWAEHYHHARTCGMQKKDAEAWADECMTPKEKRKWKQPANLFGESSQAKAKVSG